MASSEAQPQTRVAIIGTGLAGLTSAYLLQNDTRHRYSVTLFEQADSLSFDLASVAVRKGSHGAVERIDMPMRAAAGGYYHNLMSMYRHLGIPLHPVRFLFVFAKATAAAAANATLSSRRRPHTTAASHTAGLDGETREVSHSSETDAATYFIHASNLHQTPPPWPGTRGVLVHLIEIGFLILCHFWFSLACVLVAARDGETLSEYLQRIWMPPRYASHYLLPLLSSVSTCTHDEMLAFPASDVVSYKKLSHGRQHYVVCGGVGQVQTSLADGISDVRLRHRVTEVTKPGDGAQGECVVCWQTYGDQGLSEHVSEEVFDRVILAVSPDVAGRIYKPLAASMAGMPTIRVESSVVPPPGPLSAEETFSVVRDAPTSTRCMHHGDTTTAATAAQTITLRTRFSTNASSRTEALHTMPCGVIVQTCPLNETDPKRALKAAAFTRTLRSTESQAIVNKIMGDIPADVAVERKRYTERSDGGGSWVNGQDNVWVTGAWCWDGMVLLEGCVVSAMRVADDFGVPVPWRK